MVPVLCRMGWTIVVAALVLPAIGLFPHPTAREAQAMMYIAVAIAIVAVGAVGSPRRAHRS